MAFVDIGRNENSYTKIPKMKDTSCKMKDKEGAGNVNGDGAVLEEEYWVEKVQNKRLYNGKVEHLLKQKRHSDKGSTWEPKVNQDFPDLIRECRLEKVERKYCGSSSAMRSTGENKETRKRKSNAESEEKKHSNKKKNTEEMTPVEIPFGPEVVTIDDNSDGDDVIFVESVHSVHNLQEALTKNQSCALCILESRVIQHDVSHATATNHRDFGELRTIVKFLGENSGSSSGRADVMKGTIPDNRNSDEQRVTVHAAGTSEILKDSYTNASRKELPAQKWQLCSEGDVTECARVQCVPLQKVLEEGLSALSAQPRPTNMQEKLEFKQQHSSTQLSKENINKEPSEQLLNVLKQRFYVLDPNNTFQQEEQQQEGLQLQQQLVHEIPEIQHISMSLAQKGAELHTQRYSNAHWTTESVSGLVSQTAGKQISGQELQKTSGLDSGPSQLLNAHTAPMPQQKQDVKNVASMQQQFSKMKLFHNTGYQQNRQQASQIHQESSGHYMSHQISEQCVQLDVPQTVGCTSPQPNVQLTPCIFQEFAQYSNDRNMVRTIRSDNEHITQKETMCQPEQLSNESNSAQFMSQASLQQSGQHVISGVKDSRAQNVYHTMKQSIQQTASELPPPPNGKCALQLPQCDRQSLACTQQQTSGLVSEPVQQRNGQCILQPLQQCVSQSSQQSGKQIVLQIPNQYSGQIVIQLSDRCHQNCTPQSVQECCESNLLKLQQQQEETESHIVHTGEAKKERQTESYLQRPGDSNLPRNPLVSSKTVQHLHMADEPSKTQSHTVSALRLKQCKQPQKEKQQQWQQRQYMPIRTPQEPQQHTLLAEYDMVLHQASSRSQARDPRNHLQPFEERISNGVLLQNTSQPLQNLKNKKIKETELKLDPVIPLCKSQLTNREGNPHNYNHQIPTSEVVCHQSQQSVNLLTMIQQQQSSQEQNSKVTANPDDRRTEEEYTVWWSYCYYIIFALDGHGEGMQNG